MKRVFIILFINLLVICSCTEKKIGVYEIKNQRFIFTGNDLFNLYPNIKILEYYGFRIEDQDYLKNGLVKLNVEDFEIVTKKNKRLLKDLSISEISYVIEKKHISSFLKINKLSMRKKRGRKFNLLKGNSNVGEIYLPKLGNEGYIVFGCIFY